MLPFASDAAAIGVGAMCGALSRYQVGRVAAERIAADPKRYGHWTGWHTAGINILGSFALGGIHASPISTNASAVSASGLSPRMKLMLGIGFCGSFTTFSTYSVDVVTWVARGEAGKALSYVVANNVCCITAAASGMFLAKKFFR